MALRRAFFAGSGSLTSAVRATLTSAAGLPRRSLAIESVPCNRCAAITMRKQNVLAAWRGLVPLAAPARRHEVCDAMNSGGLQPGSTVHPVARFSVGDRRREWGEGRPRFLEFFAANIRNPNTRRAYGRAESRYSGVERGR